MFKRNTSVAYFPIGRFVSTTDGSEVTTGTPTGKYSKDGTAGTLSGTIAYNTSAAEWGITGLTATETNGDVVGLNFTLAGCVPIHYTVPTTTKTIAELNDAVAAPTVIQIRTDLDTNSTKLANLDATVSSRSTFDSTTDAVILAGTLVTLASGVVKASPSPSTTAFTVTLSDIGASASLAGQAILFQSGALQGESRLISTDTITGSDHALTFATAFPVAPAANDTLVIGS